MEKIMANEIETGALERLIGSSVCEVGFLLLLR